MQLIVGQASRLSRSGCIFEVKSRNIAPYQVASVTAGAETGGTPVPLTRHRLSDQFSTASLWLSQINPRYAHPCQASAASFLTIAVMICTLVCGGCREKTARHVEFNSNGPTPTPRSAQCGRGNSPKRRPKPSACGKFSAVPTAGIHGPVRCDFRRVGIWSYGFENEVVQNLDRIRSHVHLIGRIGPGRGAISGGLWVGL